MAYPLTHTTTELLDTLVTSTINTMTSNTAWVVDNHGEKLIKKVAARGRVFNEINDANEVEHTLLAGAVPASSWKYYRGSRETGGDQTMGSATGLALSQEGIYAPVRSTIQDVASNFVIPQDLVKRPVQRALNTIEDLVKRHMKTFFREQESYLVIGDSAPTGTVTRLAPHLTDADFGSGTDYSIPSFSLLGLMISGTDTNDGVTSSQYGDLSAEKFMGLDEDTESEWVPYRDAVDNDGAGKTAIATNGQTIYEYLQKYIIEVNGRYGMDEGVTDWCVTPEMYEEILKYMRSLSVNNDVLLNNLATTSEIPISGTMLDFHHFLASNTLWDITSETTPVATHPIFGLNMNSLRLNMVYGSANEDSWLTPISDFQPAEQQTWLFKRLHARFCWSLDNGRRSFVYSDRFKA